MTTGKSSIAAPSPPVQAVPACKFDGRHRRKFRRACCCIAFLLLINIFLLIHTAHSIGAVMWFVINGSYTYKDTTYLFVPGGSKSLCNDLCVDICIYNQVNCDLNSCLNLCNQQLIDDGNDDDFQPLPQETPEEEPMELVDTPPTAPKKDAQVTLNKMQVGIEKAAAKLRGLKKQYAAKCASNPAAIGCSMTKTTIKEYIAGLKQSIAEYNNYAVSFQIDITVVTWMDDVDDVTAEP